MGGKACWDTSLLYALRDEVQQVEQIPLFNPQQQQKLSPASRSSHRDEQLLTSSFIGMQFFLRKLSLDLLNVFTLLLHFQTTLLRHDCPFVIALLIVCPSGRILLTIWIIWKMLVLLFIFCLSIHPFFTFFFL